MRTPVPFVAALVATVSVCVLAPGCGKKESPIASSPSASTVADPPAPPPPAPAPSPWLAPTAVGSVRGRVTFRGKLSPAKEVENPRDGYCEKVKPRDARVTRIGANEGLLDVVVRVAPGTVKGDPARAPSATLTQEGCMYSPRVLGVLAGGNLELVNNDRTMHNIHGFAGDQTVLNAGQAMGSPPIRKPAPKEPGIVRVKCDVHPWMVAWLVVTDHPYFTSVGEDGGFSLEVPAGSVTLEAFHPLHGTKSQKAEVGNGAVTSVTFAFTDADKSPVP